MGGNREPLEKLLRDEIGGNLAALLERLKSRDSLSVLRPGPTLPRGQGFARHQLQPATSGCRTSVPGHSRHLHEARRAGAAGNDQGRAEYVVRGRAGNLANDRSAFNRTEGDGRPVVAATESEAPLVVDQPEDDLDNRFITEGVVPTMKDEKRKRQFVFSTHNANIPVLGDAELIIGLSTGIQNEAVQGRIGERHMGSIDMQPVREMVEEILEGGKTAFEMRRLKYGF
jgi:hypothetical protein